MFIDARTVETGSHLETDLCIIGAGAAGITIARWLFFNNFLVAVL